MNSDARYVRWFDDLGRGDLAEVGGKNASLGELISELATSGVPVPFGFATTADAYGLFLETSGLSARIQAEMEALEGGATLSDVGARVRALIRDAPLPDELASEIRGAYRTLGQRTELEVPDVAVRSSATAEDLPEASFAGQQESYLNVRGEEALLRACRDCYASLFTDRAIAYRAERGFDHLEVALSIGVQRMVRSDRGAAGVMFTLDTESGFRDLVVINGAYGLGETVVQGMVTPDEYRVYKPLLAEPCFVPIIDAVRGDKTRKMIYGDGGEDRVRLVPTSREERRSMVLTGDEVLELSRWGVVIEAHYGGPMDIEWAKDGLTGELFIVQARPETVQSRKSGESLRTYALRESGHVLASGLSVGDAIGSGPVFRLDDPSQGARFETGGILVTAMTDPDWGPIMRRAAAIVTDHGGRTSHAAIVSRELGVPAVVGTGDATSVLSDGQEVTVSCAEGVKGKVYEGSLAFDVEDVDLESVPKTRTKVMINLGDPDAANKWWNLPCDGVGLARMEFVISQGIKAHPMALLHPERVKDPEARRAIDALIEGSRDPASYFVDHLAYGIAKIAASRFPDPVVVRFSDFKTNEYADLLGGRSFEPTEANPMLGFRGASRYDDPRYREAFALECEALRKVRSSMGLDNVIAMIPFCRTLGEADRVLERMAELGLERGKDGFRVYVMIEIPANVLMARELAERFDGFSVGSNDLTQLTLGVDRDSTLLSHLFDERDEAVRRFLQMLAEAAHEKGVPLGLCGQAPSDHPDFAAFLVSLGFTSMSVDPRKVVEVRRAIAEAERRLDRAHGKSGDGLPAAARTRNLDPDGRS
jgi:pyruvate,water dikinase